MDITVYSIHISFMQLSLLHRAAGACSPVKKCNCRAAGPVLVTHATPTHA
jgi:hypothetical protein